MMTTAAKPPEIDRDRLNERQARVLKLVCDSFIQSGEPVGSRTLAKARDLPCSPATIRNEMADLEEFGFLASPHTSAGRIPTEAGFSFYVRFLMDLERLSQREEALIGLLAQRYEEAEREADRLLRVAARLTSDLNRLPAMLVTPRHAERRLVGIRLLPMSDRRLLVVAADESGQVIHHLLPVDESIDAADLEKLGRYLESNCCHRTATGFPDFATLRRGEDLLHRYNRLLRSVVARLLEGLRQPDPQGILLEGFVRFFDQPEFTDPDRARQILGLLDQKERLLDLMATTINTREMQVGIGSRNGLATPDLSLVSAPYSGPDGSTGCLGLIGPVRMNYARVIATLGEISRRLSEILSTTPLKKFEMRT